MHLPCYLWLAESGRGPFGRCFFSVELLAGVTLSSVIPARWALGIGTPMLNRVVKLKLVVSSQMPLRRLPRARTVLHPKIVAWQ
jgi:hypothetical protein